MTIKRTKIRRGAMEYERVKVTVTKPTQKDLDALVEMFKAATPRARVDFWKPHVERLKVGRKDLAEAKSLIDPRGEVSDMAAFDRLLKNVQGDVELMQLGKTLIPSAAYGEQTKQERKRGGANSHEMSADDRRLRDEQIQAEIDHLCLEKGLSFKRARVFVAQKHSLHPDHLKRIAKNPLA